jgi:YD repeat-containing protein
MSRMPRTTLSVFLFFALCLPSIELLAQSGIYDRVGIIPGHGTFGSLPEEHIDLFTGNVTLRYRDIYLPGPNGLDVEVWRIYNSKILKDRQSGNPSVQAYHQSWVGMGWTMHMGMVHSYSSATPVIEFPDGRLETAYPNAYGLGSNICLTRDFMKYDKTTAPPYTYPRLYFKDGTIWTFGATATITRADGTSDPVRLVTKIESPYGHHIDIVYDPGLPTIQTITDATGRAVTFETVGAPKRLVRIKVKDSHDNDRIFNYSVGFYPNYYHRLESFTAPLLQPTTFEYLDGSNSQYELTRMTTCYGGVLEYSYVNQTFYFNGIALDSRVMSQKRITFDPGNQATWNFTYPSYQGAATGTVQVQGPVFNTSITYYAYTASTPWKIGLIAARQAGDGSYSDAYDWTYQQISSTNWTVLGTNLGAAKGPLALSVIEGRVGDASSKTEFLYERTEVKRYGLPTRINRYLGVSGPLKSGTYPLYYFEAHAGFKSRHMMDYLSQESVLSSQGQLVKKADTTYYEETDKWGALKQVKRWKGTGPDLAWDYEYTCTDPNAVGIKVDPPGFSDKETVSYLYGVKSSDSLPDYTRLTRIINYRDSSISSEKRQDEGIMIYSYDNLGRITDIELMGNYNDIHYDWSAGANHMTITREDDINGDNTVTKFWDGMGRDLGSTETGEGIALTLYSRRTLDAEGRVLTESKGSDDDGHVYTYAYNAAGQVTSITDPRRPQLETTTISYLGTTKTVTDPEGHATTYVYGDLPGLPTQVIDAMGRTAVYSYDAAGRLLQVIFNGTRNHTYTYDGLDNVLTEIHPETGTISYAYNNENLLGSKTWGGSMLGFNYDVSKRLVRTTATTGGPIDTVDYSYNTITGRVESIVDITTGRTSYIILSAASPRRRSPSRDLPLSS